MTRFNPENKKELKGYDTLSILMSIDDKADAIQFFSSYVEYIHSYHHDVKDISESLKIAKGNVSYYSVYYDSSVSKRIHDFLEDYEYLPIVRNIKINQILE
jgi:hypothetical protein